MTAGTPCRKYDADHQARVERYAARRAAGLMLFDDAPAPPLVRHVGWTCECIHCGRRVSVKIWNACLSFGWRVVQTTCRQGSECVECPQCAREWDQRYGSGS